MPFATTIFGRFSIPMALDNTSSQPVFREQPIHLINASERIYKNNIIILYAFSSMFI
jgi:hypothetical protein